MKSFISPLLVATATFGCITTHHGYPTSSTDKGLLVSCGLDSHLSYKHYQMLNCTFENAEPSWKVVEVASVEIHSQETSLKVSAPMEIKDYLAAYRFERRKSDYNTNLVLAGLVVAGAVASRSTSSYVRAAGHVSALGAGSTLIGGGLYKAHAAAQYSYGDEHILGGEFRIPAKMFVRKNILVERFSTGHDATQAKVCLARPSSECFKIDMRPKSSARL